MHRLGLLTLLFLPVLAASAAELDPWLRDEALWRSPAPAFQQRYDDVEMSWVSDDHQALRAGRGNTFLGLPALEAVVQFRAGKPAEVGVVLYSRGDAGEISRNEFQAVVSNAQQRLANWAGKRATPVGDQLKTAGVRREGVAWTRDATEARLLWSYTSKSMAGRLVFRPEYVKVQLAAASGTPGASTASGPVSASGLKARIKHDANGDVVLTGVPMVDQGEKGYCAVASAERVLRFYGMDVDQHELAQLASSSAAAGTDPRAMLESLRRVGVKLGCKVSVLEEFSVQEFQRMIERYNQLARKRRLETITLGQVIDITAVYARMETTALRDVRNRMPAHARNFLDDVSRNIEQGIPLLWGVQLGKIKEPLAPQARGGHMRLIIGSNAKTGEILYTDSWGPGHELKRMALADAWAITCSLYRIEPRHTTL